MKSFYYYRLALSCLLMSLSMTLFAQKGVVIGGTTLDPSAILEMNADSQGMLVPRMNTLQRDNNILSPAAGLLIYNTDNGVFNKYINNSLGWKPVENWAMFSGTPNDHIRTSLNAGIGESWSNIGFTIRGQVGNVANFLVKGEDGLDDFRLSSDGNVGIGHFYPNVKLIVRDNPNNDFSFFVEDSDGNADFVVGSHGGVGVGAAFSSTRFNVRNQAGMTNSFVVEDSDGNNDFIVTSDGSCGIRQTASNTAFLVRPESNDDYSFVAINSSGTGQVYIAENGKMGVGTVAFTNASLSVSKPTGTTDLYINVVDSNNEWVYQIQGDGDLFLKSSTAAKNGGGEWANSSDRRLKRDIVDYTEGLDLIKKIRPVWYTYNGKGRTVEGTRFVGVIAQELQEVAPHMVIPQDKDEKDGIEYLSVDASAMKYMLINAVQEQQEQIETQQTKIETLQTKYDELLQRLEALEKK